MKQPSREDFHKILSKINFDWEEVKEKETLQSIKNHWKDWVDPRFGSNSSPESLQGGILWIKTTHPSVTMEAGFEKGNWIQSLNSKGLPTPIKEIRIH